MAGKFTIKQGADSKFRFNLKAGNGEIILQSEAYESRAACDKGVESVKKNAPADERYEKLTASDGRFYFTLKAANHQVIGQSQMYKSDSGRDGGIASVKSHAPTATVVDGE
jgi:uncharacterized protein YegP (UPF0339 family)